MIKNIGRALYLVWWQLRTWFGRRSPLQSVIFILDKCNLRCKHCSVYAITTPRIKTLEQIRTELEYCYSQGSRFVDFEGGELYLWKDCSDGQAGGRDYDINDVVDLAHKLGFWSVTITTNAQLPFCGSHADQIWVSMDGVGKWHDEIRGEGTFKRLEENIKTYSEQKTLSEKNKKTGVCVNMVINRLNYPCLDEVMEYVKNNPYIDEVSFNFHTPFSETEDLFLDADIRNATIDKIIDYKHRGYPVMNSISGLRAMKMQEGKTLCGDKYCWITNFIFSDGSRAPKCMGYTHGVCDRCGFSMGGEMHAMQHLKPDTLLSAMKLRW